MKVRLGLKSESSHFQREFKERIHKLRKYIDNNIKEIKNMIDEATDGDIDIATLHFNSNLAELTQLEEILSSSSDDANSRMVSELSRMFRELENQYLNMQISSVNKRIIKEDILIEESRKKIETKINDITGNILFSVIAIVLGLSLVSSMIEAIKSLDAKLYLVFYTTVTWIATVVMGLSYLLLRSYDKKSKNILFIICLVTLVLIGAFIFTFIFVMV